MPYTVHVVYNVDNIYNEYIVYVVCIVCHAYHVCKSLCVCLFGHVVPELFVHDLQLVVIGSVWFWYGMVLGSCCSQLRSVGNRPGLFMEVFENVISMFGRGFRMVLMWEVFRKGTASQGFHDLTVQGL